MCDEKTPPARYVETRGSYSGGRPASTMGPPAKIPSGYAAPPAAKPRPKRKAS